MIFRLKRRRELNKNKIICINRTADVLKLWKELLHDTKYIWNGKVLHQWKIHFMALAYFGIIKPWILCTVIYTVPWCKKLSIKSEQRKFWNSKVTHPQIPKHSLCGGEVQCYQSESSLKAAQGVQTPPSGNHRTKSCPLKQGAQFFQDTFLDFRSTNSKVLSLSKSDQEHVSYKRIQWTEGDVLHRIFPLVRRMQRVLWKNISCVFYRNVPSADI